MTNEKLSSPLLWKTARNDWWGGKDNLEIPQLLMFTGRGGKKKKDKVWERERVFCRDISINFMRQTSRLAMTVDLSGSRGKCTKHLLTFAYRASYTVSAKKPTALPSLSPPSGVAASPNSLPLLQLQLPDCVFFTPVSLFFYFSHSSTNPESSTFNSKAPQQDEDYFCQA